MEINVTEKKEVVYWSWGCGGHQIRRGALGGYTVHMVPNPNHHAYAWIPHFVTTKNASLKYHPGPYIGWKEMYLGHHHRIAVFLREFKGNKIILTKEDQARMRDSAIHFGYDWQTLILSEIVFHDKDMNPICHYTNLFQPLYQNEIIEMTFDFRTAEEKVASEASWEKYEREREARGALM